MSFMGELTFFLGLQVKQRTNGIFLSQDKYVYDILKKFVYSSVKTTSTPMETHKPLTKDENGTDVDVHLYRSMIGSLYLTSSRPDIMFVGCACLRFQVQPKASHMHAVKRISRYLKGQPTLGLLYPNDPPLELIAYSDSDYAGASLDRKSTTGGCQFLGCRLVAQGYNQQEGIDYDETYAPVARLESIRILLAYACALDFKLFQMDVKSAFLNGFINEEVYVAQPPGFIDFEKPDHVYKLRKALYGLKQAPKAWYDRLKAFLIKHEYKIGMVDNTLFTKKKSSNLIIVQIYVDDIIFGSTCQDMCDEFAKIMHDEFEMSMMGELNFFLGLQIKQMEDGIFFNQSKYIKEMLKKFGLEDSKPMKTPMSSDTKLTKDEECESVDSTKYRGMIGSLLYLTASRPDIMFSVCLCARFQEAPKTSHLEAVKRIFRYIKGTTHLGLWYPKGTGIETVVYADSDHAGDYVDRKSTSGTSIRIWYPLRRTDIETVVYAPSLDHAEGDYVDRKEH
ncbi:retrovirus-related pol polyprotein from transposon TNT 1-94 [Tanacetum coccineum]